jgi:CheY-like chemotaxis protein
MNSFLPVLFLDDDAEITDITKMIFEDFGFELVTFNEGHKALNYLKDNKVSLIMTDLQMPKMDGFEFYQEVKKTQNAETPTILVSGSIEETIAAKAKELGFTGSVKKPFDMEEIIRHVRELVEKFS